jgi:uncharacterized UBP type Zn finger protein
MAETSSSKQHVSVPGMCNTGNTCYLNAALQAMASSQVLCKTLSQLAGSLQASSSSSSSSSKGQLGSVVWKLLAAVTAAAKFILHGKQGIKLKCTLSTLHTCLHMQRMLHIALNPRQDALFAVYACVNAADEPAEQLLRCLGLLAACQIGMHGCATLQPFCSSHKAQHPHLDLQPT